MMLRILACALLAQSSQGLAPRAASTRRRWLAAAPGLLLLRPSEPATAVTPGGEFCICNDKGCFGENCGGLKRPDVKYLGAATESYGQELSGASAESAKLFEELERVRSEDRASSKFTGNASSSCSSRLSGFRTSH